MIDALSLLVGAASAAAQPPLPPPLGPNRGSVESAPAPTTDVDGDPMVRTSLLPAGVSLELSATWTSTYAFRGYVQEDSGFIFQPAVTIGHDLLEEVGDAPSLGLYFTNWNSFHSAKTAAQASPESWYETDLIVGAALGWRGWTLDAALAWYLYPSDAAETILELDVLLACDLPDDTWYGTILGEPYALLAIELDNRNAGANRSGNTYLEFGAGPSFEIADDLGVSVPVAVGLGLNDYYLDDDGDSEVFGFVSITPTLSWAVAQGRHGALALEAGVSVQFLGQGARATNRGDDTLVVGFVGLGWSF